MKKENDEHTILCNGCDFKTVNHDVCSNCENSFCMDCLTPSDDRYICGDCLYELSDEPYPD